MIEMKTAGMLLALIVVLVIFPIADGHLADISTISTNKPWIKCDNGVSVATVTIRALNKTTGPVSGSSILFSLDNTSLANLTGTVSTTDSLGYAKTYLRAKKVPQNVTVSARITSSEGFVSTVSMVQAIDHDTPVQMLAEYPVEAPVSSLVHLSLSFRDRWNNPADNRSGNHTLLMYAYSDTYLDDTGFLIWNGTYHDAEGTLDENGNLTAEIVMPSEFGRVLVNTLDAYGDLPDFYGTIDAYEIIPTITPTPTIAPTPAPTSTPLIINQIRLQNLTVVQDSGYLYSSWETVYSGSLTVNENVYWRGDTGPWCVLDTFSFQNGTHSTSTMLDMTQHASGGYRFRIYATAGDAPDAELFSDVITTVSGKSYILLQ